MIASRFSRTELGVLRQVRLHDPQLHPATVGVAARGHAPSPEGGEEPRGPRTASRRRPAARSGVAGPERRRRRADQDGEDRQAVEPDERGRLHQPEVLAERHAERVPRKAREDVPAQPFARRSGRRRGRRAALPPGDQRGARAAKPKAGKEREQRRQAEHAERQGPGELIGLDEEGGAKPPQPGDEIAEAPPPAGDGGRDSVGRRRSDRTRPRRRRGARPRP